METEATLEKTNGKKTPVPSPVAPRLGYTIEEFAALFGKHKNWGYRLVWKGKVKVIKPLGEMLIPHSEAQRLTESPADYDTLNA
jgi:hypothetical protein